VLTLALTTARTASARNLSVLAEGGTTDSEGDTGHLVIGGLINTTSNSTKTLHITIAYEDNFIDESTPSNSFICNLTNPADLVFSGGLPVQAAVLTISAGDTCFRTIDPTFTFSNVGKSLSFRSYTIGGQTRFKSTSSTLLNAGGDTVGIVAILGELEPSGNILSNQATGDRFITGFGGAVDTDDTGADGGASGHMAMAGLIQLNPLKKGVTTGTAKALDVTIDYQDFFFDQHLACHLINPADVSYTLVKGVGTLTLTVGSAGECDTTNTGNFIKFALYAGGSTGRIVSTSSTLIDNDLDVIDSPAIAGEFSTPGGS